MPESPNEQSELLSTPGLAAGERGPPIAAKALHFFRAMGRMIASGGERVSAEAYHARLIVCDGCEMRNGKWCTHKECGCNLLLKAALATEDCPLKKWPAQCLKNVK